MRRPDSPDESFKAANKWFDSPQLERHTTTRCPQAIKTKNPTFDGLRLSLSESSRLKYGDKPDAWVEYIEHVKLKNDNIDIDVSFTPGLNVVIGSSSSGKSLLIDSVVLSISNDFSGSLYVATQCGVQDIEVSNPAGQAGVGIEGLTL